MTKNDPKERRRGDRLMVRVPVQIKAIAENGSQIDETVETCVANSYGALVRLKDRPRNDSDLTLVNQHSGKSARFRVVWIGDQLRVGLWDVAIEILEPTEDFWGMSVPAGSKQQ